MDPESLLAISVAILSSENATKRDISCACGILRNASKDEKYRKLSALIVIKYLFGDLVSESSQACLIQCLPSIAKAFTLLSDAVMEQLLQFVLQKDSEAICCAALKAIGAMGRKNQFVARMILHPLIGILSDESQLSNVRCAAASAVGRISACSKEALKWGKENSDRLMKDDGGKLLHSSFWRNAVLSNLDEVADSNLIVEVFRGIEARLRSTVAVHAERDECLIALARIALAHPRLAKDVTEIMEKQDLMINMGVESFIKLAPFIPALPSGAEHPDGSVARLDWFRRYQQQELGTKPPLSYPNGSQTSSEAAFLTSFSVFRPAYFARGKIVTNSLPFDTNHMFCSPERALEMDMRPLDNLLGCDISSVNEFLKSKTSIVVHAAVQMATNHQLLLRPEFTTCFRKVLEEDRTIAAPADPALQPPSDRLADVSVSGRFILMSWLKKVPECSTNIWNSIAAFDDQAETALLSAISTEPSDGDTSAMLLRRLAPRPTSIFSQLTIPTYQSTSIRSIAPQSVSKAVPRRADAPLDSAAKRRKIMHVDETQSNDISGHILSESKGESARLAAPAKQAQQLRRPQPGPTNPPERKGNKLQEKAKTVENCRFWKITGCRDGDQCRFLHEGEPGRKDELCKFYKTNSCKKGDSCPYSHDTKRVACENMLRGNSCVYGDNCHYSHDPSIIESAKIKREDQKRREAEMRAEQEAKERELRALPFLTSPFAASSPASEVPHMNYSISPLVQISSNQLATAVSSATAILPPPIPPPLFAGMSLPFDSTPSRITAQEPPAKEAVIKVVQPPPAIAPFSWQAPSGGSPAPSSASDELAKILGV